MQYATRYAARAGGPIPSGRTAPAPGYCCGWCRWPPPPRWALSSIWRDCPAQDEVGRQRASDPLAPNRTGDHQVVGLSRVARVSGLLSSSSWSRSAQPRSLPGLSNPAGSRDCFTATTSGRITPCLPSSTCSFVGVVNLDVVVAKYLHDGVKTFGRGIAHQLQTAGGEIALDIAQEFNMGHHLPGEVLLHL